MIIPPEQWRKIRAIVLDIDGILTDGRIGYGGGSGEEIKFFHVRDGHGIKLALRAGLLVGALSGRQSEANRRRAEELGFSFLYEKKHDKLAAFQELLAEHRLEAGECLYMGDDVVDLPVMRTVGIAVTVADAPDYMDTAARWRTAAAGGCGAVREAIERLLLESGRWDAVMARYGLEGYRL
ncbi:3-deoxy-D-manno-octulosonate 8-phosphate phosphatase KdsC [bioreactor metagenome]|uniref:3-deoxy-D-manno-octulosonate 8-phosphate phosphatase KdsC n=1 Tax=bioreactor metagenome TaxID=1076179 RepID=A0A644ZJB8_9ZZZZ